MDEKTILVDFVPYSFCKFFFELSIQHLVLIVFTSQLTAKYFVTVNIDDNNFFFFNVKVLYKKERIEKTPPPDDAFVFLLVN